MGIRYRLLVFCMLMVCCMPMYASADYVDTLKDVPNWNDFDFGPTSFPLVLQPNQSVTKTLQVTNRTGSTADFFVEVEDFEGSQDSQQAVVLQGSNKGTYSAKDWVSIEKKQFTLEHGQRQFFDVTITVPADADAGDHYVSVLVKTSPKDTSIQNMPNIRLTSRAGSLFFVQVPGVINKEGKLNSFQANKYIYTEGSADMNILFSNTGTVRLTPSGSITIKNIFGKTIDVIDVETFSALRNSVRSLSKQWMLPQFGIGLYSATLQLDRGYDDYQDTQTISLWFISRKGVFIILTGILIFMVLVWIVRKKINIQIGFKK